MKHLFTSRINKAPLGQRGMVSLTVTVILMLVISLTVLSFAQIIRREQRQALDNQLSTQAFYAAESGINAARQYIKDNYAGTIPPNKTDCPATPEYALNGTIDGNIARYTCLLITGKPKSLNYDLSTTQASKVFPIDANGTEITKLKIDWTPSDTGNLGLCNQNGNANSLPPADEWQCTYGIVRLDLVPMNNLSREAFMKNTFTAFLTPRPSGATSVGYYAGNNIHGGNANQGTRPTVKCNDTKCEVTITGMETGMDISKYYARAMTLYRDTSLTVTALDASDNPLPLVGAQIVIDSTGRSQDVLRRLQVRVPLVNDGLHADYGLQSTESICKQFATYPGDYTYPMGGC